MARHMEVLDRELTAIAQGTNDRLIIQMPPRHGKSYLVSEHLPAWFLTQYPESSLLLAEAGL